MIDDISQHEKSGYFRWFDSGDLQSVDMLRDIAAIARALPRIKFWLPTREYSFVKEYLASEKVPKNLTIRLSAHKIDGSIPNMGLPTSCIVSDPNNATCPAPRQGGKCLDCRQCWSKQSYVAYKLH